MSYRLTTVLSWAIFLLAAIAVVGTLVLAGIAGGHGGEELTLWVSAPVGLTFAGVGALLAHRRPANPVGWLIGAWGLLLAFRFFAQSYIDATLTTRSGLPGADWLAWGATWTWHPAFALLAFLLLTFPHGRLLSPRWRPLAWLTGGVYGALAVAAALSPDAEHSYFPGVRPVLRTPVAGVADTVYGLLLGAQLVVLVAALACLLLRFVRSVGAEREQIKWFVYSVAVSLVVFISGIIVLGHGYLGPVFVVVPVATGIAVLRYRLYAIDRLVSRTVSYGVVSGLLIAAYVGLVAVFGQLVGQSSLSVAAATLAVAALFQPVRRRVQVAVDRRFNRARYDAAGGWSRSPVGSARR